MNRILFSLIVALVTMFGCLGNVQAQEFIGKGEPIAYGSKFYLQNVKYHSFVTNYKNEKNNGKTSLNATEAELLIASDNSSGKCMVSTTYSGVALNPYGPRYENPASKRLSIEQYQSGDDYQYRMKYSLGLDTRYMGEDGNRVLNRSSKGDSDAYRWRLITEAQYNTVLPGKTLSTQLDKNGIDAIWSVSDDDNIVATYKTSSSSEWCVEAFKWAGTPTGEYLTLTVSGLENGYYELKMGACASSTSSRDNGNATPIVDAPDTYASLHANNVSVPMTAYNQLGCESLDEYTLTGINVTDGTMKIYINIDKANVNWVLGKIKELKKVDKVTLSVNTMGSFVAPFDVTLPDGVTAWITTDSESSDGYLTITQTATEGTLPANTPVILRGTGSQTYYGIAEGEENANGNGFLVGVYKDTTVPQGNYVLQKQTDEIMLYKVESNDITLKAYRAYLNGSQVSGSKLRLVFSDETTGIATVEEEASVSAIYSASGAKLNAMQKGLNIIKMSNGSVKKVMVK